MNFTYVFPKDFKKRVLQILQRNQGGGQIATAFQHCNYEYDDKGLAYYAGMIGNNWDKMALDFTIVGPQNDIAILQRKNQTLKDAVEMALRSSTTGFLLRKLIFLPNDIADFPASNEERLNADIETANSVLSDLIKIGQQLASNALYRRNTPEDSINDYFRDALLFMGYNEVKDQTRHGISKRGKDAGEVDILITKESKEVAIYEGLKLESVNTSYINDHIVKAITNYNALGTATFVVAYVSVADFEQFWTKYSNYIKEYAFPIQVKRDLRIRAFPDAATRVAEMILSRDGYDFPVYFIALKIC